MQPTYPCWSCWR